MYARLKTIIMRKLFILATSVALVGTFVTPANAETENVIAVIDSGFDSSQFASNIVEEVCVTATRGCNNRTGFEIGSGAAGSANQIRERSLEDWNHGTLMVQTILSVNPDAKLVLVRNSKVYGSVVLPGTEDDFAAALQWVSDNAQDYNIVAVSFSRGSHKYVQSNRAVSRLTGMIKIYQGLVDRLNAKGSRIAHIFEKKLNGFKEQLAAMGNIDCPVNATVDSLISDLQDRNVATIVATGNDADKSYADYPACVEDAVAVSATDNTGNLVYVSNIGPNTDFAAEAPTTSEATAKLAAKWAMMYNGSYDSTYDLMVSSGTKTNHHSAIFVP